MGTGVAAQGERERRHLDTKAKQRATKAQLTKMFMCCRQCKSERDRVRERGGSGELQCARMCSYKLQLVRNVCQSELSEIGIQDCVTEQVRQSENEAGSCWREKEREKAGEGKGER